MDTASTIACIPFVRTVCALAKVAVRAAAGSGQGGGPSRISFEILSGWCRAKFTAIRQPIEWAMRVAPEVMRAWAKRPAMSEAKEGMVSLLSGEVGERPWPSRSERWREWDDERFRAAIKGV